jgi:hypothetical protein
MTEKPIIKLQRLRCSSAFYNNLDLFIEFFYNGGYEHLSSKDEEWLKLRKELDKRKVKEKFDFGDIKSTIRMLDIIQNSEITEFGKKAYEIKKNEEKLKQLLADKMIKEKEGWAYCNVLSILSGKSREELADLYQELFDPEMQEEYTDISKYNIFLEWLGIAKKTGSSYVFVQEKFEKLMGIKFRDIELIDRNLKPESKLCLLALIRLNSMEEKDYDVKEVRNAVRTLYGEKLNTHHMQHYAEELRKIKFISYSHKGKGENKKRGSVGQWRLNKENSELKKFTFGLLEKFFLLNVDWDLGEVIDKSFKKILEEMKVEDKYKKGVALEQFASKICWVLGLRNIKNRVLEEGVELDVTANKLYPFFTKFLIQCKNHKNSIGVPVLVKELGIASVEKYNHLIIFSTSGFVSNMRPYVNKSILSTGINVYLFDNEDIELISKNPNAIYQIFERENKIIEGVREGTEGNWFEYLK